MTEKLYIAKVKYGKSSFVTADIVRETPKGSRIENIAHQRGNLYIPSLVMKERNQYRLYTSLPDALSYIVEALAASQLAHYERIAETEEEQLQVGYMVEAVRQAAHDAKFFPTD